VRNHAPKRQVNVTDVERQRSRVGIIPKACARHTQQSDARGQQDSSAIGKMGIQRSFALVSGRILKSAKRDDQNDCPRRYQAAKIGSSIALHTGEKWPYRKKSTNTRKNPEANKIRGALSARTVSNCRSRPRHPEQQRMMPHKPWHPRVRWRFDQCIVCVR
jgi:hypothetical protein